MIDSDDLTMKFDLGAILSLTTGRKYADMYDIEHLTWFLLHHLGIKLSDIDDKILGESLLKQHPELKGVGSKETTHFSFEKKPRNKIDFVAAQIEVDNYINKQKMIYGECLPVRPLMKSDLVDGNKEENQIKK